MVKPTYNSCFGYCYNFVYNSRSAEERFLLTNDQLESKALELNEVLETSQDYKTKYEEEVQVRKQ
jgi:hypothetical protein